MKIVLNQTHYFNNSILYYTSFNSKIYFLTSSNYLINLFKYISFNIYWSNIGPQWRSQYRGKGGRVPLLTAKHLPKIGKNQERIGKKEEKSGRKGKNREDSVTLPLLTERAGYATVGLCHSQ